MANEFIARKGLIALDNSQITGSLDVSGSLSITGISDVSASIAAAGGGSDFPYTGSAIISGSLEVIGKITGSVLIEGSGSTLFEIVGSEGQLFSVTDNLSGSLFAVSDVSGLPILEVFSDDTVKIGTFNNEAIIVNGSTAIVSGSFSGSFEGDGSGLTGIPAAAGTLSSSAQIATDISGAFISTSASIASDIATNTSNIATLTAATSSYSTATGVENNADVTDFTNVQAAGALMDSEVTSLSLIKGLTAAQISGAFDATSASLAADIPTNNNQLTNGAGYTTNTGTVTSVGGTGTVSGLSLSGTVTTSGNLTLGGTISISSTNITDVDAFSQSGTYASLRAQGTTAGDVGLGNVTNESKATMFTSPTFTGTVAIPGFADVSASLAAAVAGGDNLGNHTATIDLNMGGNDIVSVGNVDGVDVSTLKSDFDTLEGKTLVSGSSQIDLGSATGTAANALTASYVSGSNVDGTVATATTAFESAFATNADKIEIDNVSTNTEYGLVFRNGNTEGYQVLYADGEEDQPSYNPATNTITTPIISASSALYVGGDITVTGTVDGVDIASLETSVQANDTKIASLTAATSSYITFPVDISDETNLIAGTGITLTGDTLSTNDSEIDHDSLSNFSSDEHFTQANITTVGTVTSGDVSAILPTGTISSSAQVDHDQTTNFSSDEHFTQANITTVGTVTSGDVSAILPTGTVSGSSQISDLGFVNNSQSARITFLYTSSVDYAPPGYIVFLDQATDNIIINTSSYNGVDLDASVGNDYAKFQFNEAGSLITVRKLSDGSFKTYKITTATTNYTGNADNVGYLVDGASFINVMESGSISDGDEVEFIWDKSAGVGGAYGPTEGFSTKTLAGFFQSGYNYLDMFFGVITDTEFDGDPENLSGIESSASFTDSRYFLPAISQSESLTLGGLTVNGTITGTINTSSITDFPTEVSRSAAAAGFGSGGGGSTTLTQIYNQSFLDDIADTIHYLPFKDINEQTTIYQEEAAMLMPFDGRIKQITIKVSTQVDNAGNFTVGVHTIPLGSNHFTTLNWTEEETETLAFDGASSADDFHAFHFVFDNAQHFEAGDLCTISLQASVDPGVSSYYYVTTIVEFDTTNGLGSSSTELATNP